MATGSYLSIITLNVNGLNAPTKRQRLAEWIQKQELSTRDHLKTRDTHRLKVKGWKKIFHANGDEKKTGIAILQFSSVQSLSRVWLFATPWIAAHQASLSITISQGSLKLTSTESVMPSSHLILCCPLFLLPTIPPSIRVFCNESTLRMRWPKYWSFR